MSKIITAAQTDEKVKVILIHGGKYFSSGNDLKALMSISVFGVLVTLALETLDLFVGL